MYFNPAETDEEQQRDGRLTIVLLLFFLLLLVPLRHRLIYKNINLVQHCRKLEVRHDNQLYLSQKEIFTQNPGSLPLTYYPFFFLPLPINRADKDLLMTIKGVGPALAETIVSHRQEVGPILNIVNLQAIHGIGRKRATALANELVFDKAE